MFNFSIYNMHLNNGDWIFKTSFYEYTNVSNNYYINNTLWLNMLRMNYTHYIRNFGQIALVRLNGYQFWNRRGFR